MTKNEKWFAVAMLYHFMNSKVTSLPKLYHRIKFCFLYDYIMEKSFRCSTICLWQGKKILLHHDTYLRRNRVFLQFDFFGKEKGFCCSMTCPKK